MVKKEDKIELPLYPKKLRIQKRGITKKKNSHSNIYNNPEYEKETGRGMEKTNPLKEAMLKRNVSPLVSAENAFAALAEEKAKRTPKEYRKFYERFVQLTRLYGCKNCYHRGTRLCPHKVQKGEIHANKICNERMQEVIESHELACGDINGKKLLHGQIIAMRMMAVRDLEKRLIEYMDADGLITKEEEPMWHILNSWLKELSDMNAFSIKQEEGTKLTVERAHDRLRQFSAEIIDVSESNPDKSTVEIMNEIITKKKNDADMGSSENIIASSHSMSKDNMGVNNVQNYNTDTTNCSDGLRNQV